MTNPDPPQQTLEQLQERHALFLRTAAHALRTPLQSLQGFAELLEPGLPPALAEHYISFIKRDAVYLAGVVDDLCLRHELARGPLRLFQTVVDVGSLLGELAQTFEARFPDCLVSLGYADDLPPIYADQDRLFQALWTLLRNAERCRPDRGRLGGLDVAAYLKDEARRVVFVVEDDGPSVPPEYAEIIFEPLAALPSDLGRPRLGIGLGLYVAREVTRQMGGHLWLAPCVGDPSRHGNTFMLEVPVWSGQVSHA
ncbi:MAG: HAMP domain-containing histidine kinase [Anaerolineales bacterium]|nr:HAMP domain-containing histidine kinase [Anaerolineales bacterium]